jgi:hypothetical protein
MVLKGHLKPDLGYFSVRPNSGADLSKAFKTGPIRPAINAVANTLGSCCPAVYNATAAAAAARMYESAICFAFSLSIMVLLKGT